MGKPSTRSERDRGIRTLPHMKPTLNCLLEISQTMELTAGLVGAGQSQLSVLRATPGRGSGRQAGTGGMPVGLWRHPPDTVLPQAVRGAFPRLPITSPAVPELLERLHEDGGEGKRLPTYVVILRGVARGRPQEVLRQLGLR